MYSEISRQKIHAWIKQIPSSNIKYNLEIVIGSDRVIIVVVIEDDETECQYQLEQFLLDTTDN